MVWKQPVFGHHVPPLSPSANEQTCASSRSVLIRLTLCACRLRVVEHNILVISKYYNRISLQRLSTLLCLSREDTEKHLSDMVVSGNLYAKVDRPAGIVRFEKLPNPDNLLNDWAGRISKLLELVERSCQQIQKESMVHKVPIGAS